MVGEIHCFIQALKYLLKTFPKKEIFNEDSPDIALMRKKLVVDMRNLRSMMAGDKVSSLAGLSDDLYDAKVNFHLASDEAFQTDENQAQADDLMFPCLLVILGSASCCIQVDRDGCYSMKDGSPRCGRTLLGLARLALGTETFDELITLAEKGEERNVDQYGGDVIDFDSEDGKNGLYATLPRNIPFFTMGKLADTKTPLESFRKEDIARSLTNMIAGELAVNIYQTAAQNNCKTVLISGNLVNAECIKKEISRILSQRALGLLGEFAFRYYFLKHGGFYGALGALLETAN